MPQKKSIYSIKPYRWDIPVMVVVALGLLIAGLNLPTLKLAKVIFFTNTYSIWDGVWELWKSNHIGLAVIIFFFSIVFPCVKLIGLLFVWFVPLEPEGRKRFLYWSGILGKWSMLDVFIVAILVILIKTRDIADANAQIGIYFFACAIMLSIAATMMIEKMVTLKDGTTE
ncbi:paraquat-inducible protein A [Candidatus Kuenenia stuttgartiensis]|jgi:paraquat-inducible protein A|nr:paraquat-inducible protein A [Candidatus Kuenenia stuttgartiensis]MCF6153151.1 paraquat-inducible protein A [Candidatus Kuenenia stuttgartiensis]QII11067.1 paraquat-inducible protein A [Candidatus Kuenenia stuttgartiensis]